MVLFGVIYKIYLTRGYQAATVKNVGPQIVCFKKKVGQRKKKWPIMFLTGKNGSEKIVRVIFFYGQKLGLKI